MFFYNIDRVLKEKLVYYLSKKPIHQYKLLIAYSGGIDSSVLLYAVNLLSIKMGFKYDFVYINHNMNPNFNRILSLGNNFSKINNSNFIYHEMQLYPQKNKESFFREYRYSYLNDLKKTNNYDFILTAHHFDDQIETIYMKTTGRYDWSNLLGIRERKDFLIRPFLKIRKNKIVSYAITNGISWVFDDTNNDNAMFRNNIRNRLLPNKKKIFSFFLIYLNKYSKINFFIFKKRIQKIEEKVLIKKDEFILLDKKNFLDLSFNYRKLFLQYIFKKYNGGNYIMAKYSKWSALWNYLSKNKNLNDFILDNNIFINNSKNLIIIKNKSEYRKKINLVDDVVWGNCIFKIEKLDSLSSAFIGANHLCVDQKIFKQGLFIRNWIIGDFYIDRKKNKKRVSRLFLKNKFNNYKKMHQPLIVDSNDNILWIPGLHSSFEKMSFSSKNNCIKISKEILN